MDDDLIVSHIAIAVEDMPELKKRLREMDIKSRKNISVPNPEEGVGEGSIVDQVTVLYLTLLPARVASFNQI